MCIIPGPVDSVSQTKLFVLPSLDKTRQMTFYGNSVETPGENVMILPVPNIGSIELHTIKYKKLFTHLRESVSKMYQPSSNALLERSVSRSCVSSVLPVFEHGSYLVSIVPRLEDLSRLDMSVFNFSPNLYTFFAKHYSPEFGYLCCKLNEGKQDYEPICYSHDIHSNERLFVPTLHYHNHNGHIDTDGADWDHMIYSVGTTENANHKYESEDENRILWTRFPLTFRHDIQSPVRCAEISGNQANRDIAFVIA